ncbi:hypothetical protein [Dyella nitratireducens]|uniref:Uncharacterized protein n=1 Tax=Dyella nitratireducens TaxID=1849580 RepID=A0ABQ1GNR6_9GAMM|nr:hypothetical protein [Dyella nitratireducens]GGA47150.1 hypothetical protein GCM10010981_40430 [Dyella nitratireducens]GLQ41545.1 hypothetical protein GCM10007902_13950 [Dyella nitratireducens]
MRDLTVEELSGVSGGLDMTSAYETNAWFDGHLSDFFRNIYDSIFENNSSSNNNNPPQVSSDTMNSFVKACIQAGGTASLVTASGQSSGNVRLVNVSGGVQFMRLTCNMPSH